MGNGRQRIGRGKKIGRGDVGRARRFRISLGEVLYKCRGFSRKKPDIRTVIWEIPHAGGKINGGRSTPGNVIDTRPKGDGDTV
jgi:hypothetical protein